MFKKSFLLKVAIVFLMSGLSLSCVASQDLEYKKILIKNSSMPEKSVKSLDSIVGEKELVKIIKRYDNNETAYMIDEFQRDDMKVFSSCRSRANFHMHTTSSDGTMSVEELLNQAAEYADKCSAQNPKEKYPFVVALTDHNTTDGDKIAVETILKNPQKYKNLKVILGMEIWAYIERMPSQDQKNGIHMLALAINPYDKAFENFGRTEREFTSVTTLINNQKYGLIGVAHPVREIKRENIPSNKTIYDWVEDMFALYTSQRKNKILFTEAYYQRYRFYEDQDLLSYIKKSAKKHKIMRTGSLDNHREKIYLY